MKNRVVIGEPIVNEISRKMIFEKFLMWLLYDVIIVLLVDIEGAIFVNH